MDIYTEPMLNTTDAGRYLMLPYSTLRRWQGADVIHSMPATRPGWPTLPFAAVVEAIVVRALRDANFSFRRIQEAVAGIRRQTGDEYGLVRPTIGHDVAEIFVKEGPHYYRARDFNQVADNTVTEFNRIITWDGQDPVRVRLTQFGDHVILDPRFGWGSPVVEGNKVSTEAIVGLFRGGDSIATIAENYDMESADVERVIRGYAA